MDVGKERGWLLDGRTPQIEGFDGLYTGCARHVSKDPEKRMQCKDSCSCPSGQNYDPTGVVITPVQDS